MLTAAGPTFDPAFVTHLGCRPDDEHLDEVRGAVALVITADEISRDPARAASAAREIVGAAPDGFWLHLDVDVLDPDLDPEGSCTATARRNVIEGLAHLGSQRATPDHPGRGRLYAMKR